jgi:hypothetical protein
MVFMSVFVIHGIFTATTKSSAPFKRAALVVYTIDESENFEMNSRVPSSLYVFDEEDSSILIISNYILRSPVQEKEGNNI